MIVELYRTPDEKEFVSGLLKDLAGHRQNARFLLCQIPMSDMLCIFVSIAELWVMGEGSLCLTAVRRCAAGFWGIGGGRHGGLCGIAVCRSAAGSLVGSVEPR